MLSTASQARAEMIADRPRRRRHAVATTVAAAHCLLCVAILTSSSYAETTNPCNDTLPFSLRLSDTCVWDARSEEPRTWARAQARCRQQHPAATLIGTRSFNDSTQLLGNLPEHLTAGFWVDVHSNPQGACQHISVESTPTKCSLQGWLRVCVCGWVPVGRAKKEACPYSSAAGEACLPRR